jgi:serine/threonine protein kinase
MLAPDDYSGRKLGKYEILCRLSMGGMSEIFLAFQKGLAGFRKFVVLKQILPDIKGEEEFVRMFLDEARITAAFAHPNIAQVFDLDIAEGELFLAMEFVPGATLVEVAKACRLAGEPIPVGFTLMAVRDTALALHYAHTFTDPMGRAVQVVHRDIAEKNIMVTYDGTTKLLDFGIAKALNRSSRTTVGMVKGTSGYMSPEQILGEPLDPRSDIFSLGVVLHECLTGMRLFHGKMPEDAMMQALKGDVAPPSKQCAEISPELDAVVLKALRRAREDRYATALELARGIERVAFPLIWHPEQSAHFIARLFADRREQTRALMSQTLSEEHTGEFRLARFLNPEDHTPAPVAAPSPVPEWTAPPGSLTPPPLRRAAPPPPSAREPVTQGPRTPARGTAQREARPVETSPGLADPPRRRSRPPPAKPAPSRSPPPPVPDMDDDQSLFPDELTIPGQGLPREVMAGEMTHPGSLPTVEDEDQTSSGGDVTADIVRPDPAEVTRTGPPPRAPRSRRGPLVAVLTLFLAVAAIGAGWALGLHEDLQAMLATPEGPTGPPPPEPLSPPAPPRPPEAASAVDAVAPAPEPEPVAAVEPATERVTEPGPPTEASPEPTPLVATPPVPAPAASPAPRPRPPRQPTRKVAGAAITPSPASDPAPDEDDASWTVPAVKTGAGTLTLITEPWSTVFMGGKELGITPMVKQKIPSGRHSLKLVGPDKKAVELPVDIVAGEETKVRVPLSVLKPL